MKQLTEEDFSHEIKNGLTLVDFYADWCGPCRMLAPILARLALKLEGRVSFAKLNIDHHPAIAEKYEATAFPTIILFKEGKEMGRMVGLRDEDAIMEFINTASSKYSTDLVW